jgi:hypothetical protein
MISLRYYRLFSILRYPEFFTKALQYGETSKRLFFLAIDIGDKKVLFHPIHNGCSIAEL